MNPCPDKMRFLRRTLCMYQRPVNFTIAVMMIQFMVIKFIYAEDGLIIITVLYSVRLGKGKEFISKGSTRTRFGKI